MRCVESNQLTRNRRRVFTPSFLIWFHLFRRYRKIDEHRELENLSDLYQIRSLQLPLTNLSSKILIPVSLNFIFDPIRSYKYSTCLMRPRNPLPPPEKPWKSRSATRWRGVRAIVEASWNGRRAHSLGGSEAASSGGNREKAGRSRSLGAPAVETPQECNGGSN